MHTSFSQQKQEERIKQLQQDVESLQAQLGEEEDADRIVKGHIRLLHQYNETKDAAQILIGRLASAKQTTVRQIHQDLDLPQND